MSAVKTILGIGAAYLLYEWYIGAFNAPASAPATGSSNTTIAAPPNVSQTQAATVLPSGVPTYGMPTVAQLQSAAGAQIQNIYQWNYWYQALTGRGSSFNQVTFPVDGATMVDAPTYLSYLKGLGLSGMGGLGHIIDLQKLFSGVPNGKGFGSREFSAISGLSGMIVDDPLMSAAYIDEGPMMDAAMATTGDDATTQDFFLAAQGQGS